TFFSDEHTHALEGDRCANSCRHLRLSPTSSISRWVVRSHRFGRNMCSCEPSPSQESCGPLGVPEERLGQSQRLPVRGQLALCYIHLGRRVRVAPFGRAFSQLQQSCRRLVLG